MENVTISLDDQCLTVRVKGELTIDVTPDIKRELDRHLENDDFEMMVMDLGQIVFLDSSGIGTLVSLHTKAQNSQREFYLYRPSQEARKTLELVHLHSFFQILDTEEDLELALP